MESVFLMRAKISLKIDKSEKIKRS